MGHRLRSQSFVQNQKGAHTDFANSPRPISLDLARSRSMSLDAVRSLRRSIPLDADDRGPATQE
jgi:hypothetical protein